MKERPILFNGDMVRAILEGRKTQTRRVVHRDIASCICDDPQYVFYRCPYGQPGDRLWVREAYCFQDYNDGAALALLTYHADNPLKVYTVPVDPEPTEKQGSHPSIHMPRWASRITLEIVSVRVERLNDISEQDAVAEGIEPIIDNSPFYGVGGWKDYMNPQSLPFDSDKPVASFMSLWKSVYGEESWQQNPWCWVVEFKAVQP